MSSQVLASTYDDCSIYGSCEPVVSDANINSITSGNNCILVNPTTGDVVITFNTSCGGSGGAVDLVDGGNSLIYVNSSTGDVYVFLNETVLNETIESFNFITLDEYFSNASDNFRRIDNHTFNGDVIVNGNQEVNGNLTLDRLKLDTGFLDFEIWRDGGDNYIDNYQNNLKLRTGRESDVIKFYPNNTNVARFKFDQIDFYKNFILSKNITIGGLINGNATVETDICIDGGNCLSNVSLGFMISDYRLKTNVTFPQEIITNGGINMNQTNITNINQLRAPDGSALKLGDGGTFNNIDQAINLQTNQTLGDGVISHILTSLQNAKIIEAWQTGKNNSWGYHRNSYGIFQDFGSANGTFLTSALEMWDALGISPAFDYDTTNQGASLGVEFGVETQQVIIHNALGNGLLNGAGLFSWTGNQATAFDVINTSIHTNLGERLENVTTGAGALTIKFISFEGEVIGTQPPADFGVSGDNSGGSTREWSVRDDDLCGENPCARAKGGNGGDTRGMDINFSTIEVSGIDLSFNYGSRDMDSGAEDGFDVQANNNEGSGWVLVFNDTTTTGDTETQEQFALTTAMENKSIVTLRFNHHATNQVEESFVDTIKINGTLGTETTVLTSQYDGEIIIGSQEHDDATCKLFFNDTTDTLGVIGDNCLFEAPNIKGDTFEICNADQSNFGASRYIAMGRVQNGANTNPIALRNGSIVGISYATFLNAVIVGSGGVWNFTIRFDGVNSGATISRNFTGSSQRGHTSFEYGIADFIEGDVLAPYANMYTPDAILKNLIVCYEVDYYD